VKADLALDGDFLLGEEDDLELEEVLLLLMRLFLFLRACGVVAVVVFLEEVLDEIVLPISLYKLINDKD